MLIVYLESNYTLHQHACIHITINTINTQLMFYLQLYYRFRLGNPSNASHEENGTIRVCSDYKLTVNQATQTELSASQN